MRRPCRRTSGGRSRPIVPAVRRVQRESAVDGAPPDEIDAEQVGREHLRDTVAELLHSSELISDAVAEGRLAIVGANYRLAEGTAVPDIIVGVVDRRRLTRNSASYGGTTT